MSGYTFENFRLLPFTSKEDLSMVNFSNSEVLLREEDIRVKRTNLDKAIALGSSDIYNTCLVLKSGEDLYKIETNVNHLTDGVALCSNGMQIPITCVYAVAFYPKRS